LVYIKVYTYKGSSEFQDDAPLRRSSIPSPYGKPARGRKKVKEEEDSKTALRYGGYPLYEDEEADLSWPAEVQMVTHRYGLGYDYDNDDGNYFDSPQKLTKPYEDTKEKKREKNEKKKEKEKETKPEEKEKSGDGSDGDDSESSSSSSSDSDWSSDDDETDEEVQQKRESYASKPLRNWNDELQGLMDAFYVAKRKTLDFEERNNNNEGAPTVPPDEEILECYQTQLDLLAKLGQLSLDFRIIAEEIAKTIIDEMTLPSKRKTYRPRTEFPGFKKEHSCQI